MKAGDLVMIKFGFGPDNGLPAHLKGIHDFYDGATGIVLEHVMGRWWTVMVGERRVEMDIKTLVVLDEAR